MRSQVREETMAQWVVKKKGLALETWPEKHETTPVLVEKEKMSPQKVGGFVGFLLFDLKPYTRVLFLFTTFCWGKVHGVVS